MTIWNVDQYIDAVLHAGVKTYVLSFAAVLLLFVFIFSVAVRLTPKKDLPEEALKWPDAPPAKNTPDKP